MIVITIKKGNPADNSLELSDKGRTHADNGDELQWHIANGSGVDSITAIGMKPSTPEPNTDIFSEAPHQVGSSKNWKGTVSDDAAPGSEYVYFIKWIADDGSGEHTFDPKIIVNTR